MPDASEISFERRIPVRHEVDVFVAGGGPAGIAAAVAAAREGASVFLAEGTVSFGGMGTAGLVPAFMHFGDGERFLAGGVGRGVYDACFENGAVGPADTRDPASMGCVCIRPEVLKRIYDGMVRDSGAEFSFQTQVIAVECEGARVAHAVCAAKSGVFAVRAKMFIDCTGDGDLAAWAGAGFEKGDDRGRMMPGTLCSLWAGVDWRKVRESGLNAEEEIRRAFGKGVFTVEDPHLPGMWMTGARLGGGNIGHTFGVDGTDERSVTEALVRGRELVLEYERYYKKYLQGFEDMELVATGSLLGVRETRRVIGDYMLRLGDFTSRASFDDEIGRYNYPVGGHASSVDEQDVKAFQEEFHAYRCGTGESYGVPYRILTPKGLDNLYVAGRCVSADRHMHGSIRVMPGCFITGQAAGIGAAMAAKADVTTRGVAVKELRGRLVELGVYLPGG